MYIHMPIVFISLSIFGVDGAEWDRQQRLLTEMHQNEERGGQGEASQHKFAYREKKTVPSWYGHDPFVNCNVLTM